MARAIALAERIVGNNADADDIGQDAFVKVWRKAKDFDARMGRFSTWLYRIVVNLSLDRRRSRPLERAQGLEQAEHVPSSAPDALAELEAVEETRVIGGALELLPERQKAAIALFHMEGLSGSEAAHVLGVSEKAFESLLIRARNALRRQISETYER